MKNYIRATKAEEKRQIKALENWINVSEETQDIYNRWQRDFVFLLKAVRDRVQEDGLAMYRNMTPSDVEDACDDVEQRAIDLESRTENGVMHIAVWRYDQEKALITMIKALAELDPSDRQTILSIRTFLD